MNAKAKEVLRGLLPVPVRDLRPHPSNPRISLREDVIESIAAQLTERGFHEKHAIHVRPIDDGFEIISGHHRVEAARRAGLDEVPAWIEELDDERAYMELALSNSQGELSPLERGIHALGYVERSQGGRGKKGGLSEYARQTGDNRGDLSTLKNAAEVYQATKGVEHPTRLCDCAYHLAAIHRADRSLWPVLVESLIAKKWSVADTEYWVKKCGEFEIPEPWATVFLPLPRVVQRFLETREFSPVTVRRLCAEAERVESILAERGADNAAWREWLAANAGGDAWDVRMLIERGREIENSLAEPDARISWLKGDWREHVDLIPAGSVAAVVTDPPYGIDYQSDYRLDRRADHKHETISNDQSLQAAANELAESLTALYPKLKENAAVFVFCAWQNEFFTRAAIERAGLAIRNSLVWVKDRTGMGDPSTTFAPKHERIIFAVKGSPTLFERLPDVLDAKKPDSKRHPTEKPTDLIKRLIEVTTVTGDLVVDPFGGVASTLVAALELERRAWGCELSDDYFASGKERLNA